MGDGHLVPGLSKSRFSAFSTAKTEQPVVAFLRQGNNPLDIVLLIDVK